MTIGLTAFNKILESFEWYCCLEQHSINGTLSRLNSFYIKSIFFSDSFIYVGEKLMKLNNRTIDISECKYNLVTKYTRILTAVESGTEFITTKLCLISVRMW